MPPFGNDWSLLLVAHGTRHPVGQAQTRALAAAILQDFGNVPSRLAYLEICQPDLATGLEALAQAGAAKILVQPLLVWEAGHAKDDIPSAVAALRGKYPDLKIAVAGRLNAPWGASHPATASLRAARLLSAWPEDLGTQWPVITFSDGSSDRQPSAATFPGAHLVMFGRGTSDLPAAQAFIAFCEERKQQEGWDHLTCGFVAAAEPNLERTMELAISAADQRGATHLLVQPYLLCYGHVWEQIRRHLVANRAHYKNYPLWLAPPLAVTNDLASAFSKSIQNARKTEL